MPKKSRSGSAFTMSFLDCMSCGFGAVILFFVIINHATEVRSDDLNAELLSEVSLLENEVTFGEKNLAELRNSMEEVQKEITVEEGRARELVAELDVERLEIAKQDAIALARTEKIADLLNEIERVEKETAESQIEDEERGRALREFFGEGDRQYLTGMRVGGDNILILVDVSASMLDDSIVNIIRRRNLPKHQKIRAAKWQRAIRTVDWLTTQIPPGSQFQIYGFNDEVKSLIPGTEGSWVEATDGTEAAKAVERMRDMAPENGTSLHQAFAAALKLSPPPDNIYLVIDSLPTQGQNKPSSRGTVTGRQRVRFFERAVSMLPVGIPLNIILFPMEGDPRAASAFWQLARATGGSFLAPARDWP